MFSGEIKVKNWTKKIKINDNGDFIEVNVNDVTYISKLNKLNLDIQDIAKSIQNVKDLDLDSLTEPHIKIANLLREFFKDDSICNKIFGTDYPSVDSVFDFLSQLSSYIEQFMEEKIKDSEEIKNKYIDKSKKRKRM